MSCKHCEYVGSQPDTELLPLLHCVQAMLCKRFPESARQLGPEHLTEAGQKLLAESQAAMPESIRGRTQ